jgi:hypothetical protein
VVSGLAVFAAASADGCFLGLATVSLLVGLSCAHTPTIKVNAAAALRIHVFIRKLSLLQALSIDDTRD